MAKGNQPIDKPAHDQTQKTSQRDIFQRANVRRSKTSSSLPGMYASKTTAIKKRQVPKNSCMTELHRARTGRD